MKHMAKKASSSTKKASSSTKKDSFSNKTAPATTKKASATKLLIVESPSKCAKIESYLGPEFQCIASCGHFREIANGLQGINHRFEPTFTWMEDKKAHITNMRKVAKSFQHVLLATDDDREGEAIAWHICQVLALPVETTPRIVFHEITNTAIQHAVANPRRVNMSVVKAQHARQVLDLMVGYKISPFLWRVFFHSKTKSLSAGRCQTPTLRLVYDNSRLDRTLELKYKTKGHTPIFPLELNHEMETPDQVRQFLRHSQTFSHILTLLPSRDTVSHPPQPLTTSRLLQVASNVLHSSPKHTMQVCQTLYQQGLITYMRTDSSAYAAPFLDTAAAYIRSTFGSDDYIHPNLPVTSGEAAHEAIRVTELSKTTIEDASTAAMYRLIWRHTLESCMAPARYNAFPVRVSAPDAWEYRASIDIPVFLGWKRVQQQQQQHKDDPTTQLLQARLYDKKTIPMQYIQSQPVAHNTHAHYTEASLVKTLEEMGIGRPSTFATLVETIQERGYVKKTNVEGQAHSITEFIWRNTESVIEETQKTQVFGQESNKLVIQPTGQACVEFLMQYFGDLFAYDYTQRMELQLDEIARSTDKDGYDMCKQCSDDIDRLSQPVLNLGKMTYPLANSSDHAVVFQAHGMSIRRTDPLDQSITYMPVSTDELDMDRVKRGEYTTTELLAASSGHHPPQHVGHMDGHDVFLKHGRYGKYLEWNGQTCSANKATTLEEAKALLSALDNNDDEEPKSSLGDEPSGKHRPSLGDEPSGKHRPSLGDEPSGKHCAPPTMTGVLRYINADCSVRQGKYGPYVYYKTSEMKSPMFFSAKKLEWKTVKEHQVLQWIREQKK